MKIWSMMQKKGTPQHDKLFCLRPLLDTLTTACKAHYHPRQNISINERMVTTKVYTGMTQFMKAKPTKWGFKLFVLADSMNGYTIDFAVYTGKSQFASGVGLAYDSVMSLIKPAFLGHGYHLYVDSFYTSPKLFKDLFAMKIGACGTYREHQKECPRTQNNTLTKKDPRGTIRWIRDGPLVFVKWMDIREVAVCSTIHPAFTGETVARRFKDQDGQWVSENVLCPNPVTQYNKNMGGVDLSHQLIQYYTVHHKTMHWYRTLFYHFLDIAATNAYILHKEYYQDKAKKHREFLEELAAQLCGVSVAVPPSKAPGQHVPVPIAAQSDQKKRASYGRRGCVQCRKIREKEQSTPWKCKVCDVALCVIADRNCFEVWHEDQ
ncbi:piggyBac transposable element-derived protein 4-like [Thalassophryne amazonica]|uniref:piggyBac transposable element-derived protein 4-like n=1 Tax=Thalassophryne amazonica TaxID=390379 RepID=UPI0014717A46|nr:piggyBac transposable element-derived protein 4-like [Thalassophryne amazonica]